MRKPRIFISVDMEGATGIVHEEQVTVKGDDYERGRALLTGDVNAAVEGAVEAGATEAVICEGHAVMRVIPIEKLHERARLVSGPASSKDLCQMEGIDRSFDAAFFVGYHARAGTPKAILPHTWLGRLIHKFRLNGRELGETGINAAIAGAYGVPVVLVTGDRALCVEAKRTLGRVETVEVKRACGPSAALCLPPSATAGMIRDAARRATEERSRYRPYKTARPVKIEISLHHRSMAEKAERLVGISPAGRISLKRTGEREIVISGNDLIATVKHTWKALEFIVSELSGWLK